MRADKVTRFLLAAIAIALWANVLGTWLEPSPARASWHNLSATESRIRSIDNNLRRIANGSCENAKLC